MDDTHWSRDIGVPVHQYFESVNFRDEKTDKEEKDTRDMSKRRNRLLVPCELS